MPELRFPSASVWKEFTLETDLISPPTLRLKVKPCFKKDVARGVLSKMSAKSRDNDDMFKTFERSAETAEKLVEDWDLTEAGEPIPCTAEAKKLYLAPLLWENIKPEPKQATEAGQNGEDTIELGGDDSEEKSGEASAEGEAVKKPKTLWLFAAITDFAVKSENFLKN